MIDKPRPALTSLPWITSPRPSKDTSWRCTPPPEATKATHRSAFKSVCTARREDVMLPGEGCMRAPDLLVGNATSDFTRLVTVMESLPSPTKRLRFDPIAAIVGNLINRISISILSAGRCAVSCKALFRLSRFTCSDLLWCVQLCVWAPTLPLLWTGGAFYMFFLTRTFRRAHFSNKRTRRVRVSCLRKRPLQ